MMMTKKHSKAKNTPKQSQQNPHGDENPATPELRFSPTAWAKLLFFRDHGETEISGFGITRPDDLLYVTEFLTVKQDATAVSISLDDEAVADFFDKQVDVGHKPEQFFRIWCHSHPGNSSSPSSTDLETFHRVFGQCNWAIMLILAQNGNTYARLRFNVGPGGEVALPVCVDYSLPFDSSNLKAWKEEYQANIKARSHFGTRMSGDDSCFGFEEPDLQDYLLPDDIIEQLEEMDPIERQVVLEELAIRPDLWDKENEVMLYD